MSLFILKMDTSKTNDNDLLTDEIKEDRWFKLFYFTESPIVLNTEDENIKEFIESVNNLNSIAYNETNLQLIEQRRIIMAYSAQFMMLLLNDHKNEEKISKVINILLNITQTYVDNYHKIYNFNVHSS
jgi:hypothetical protein